ncbi:MAG: elongation factor P maturation arginine rhamnosyltransferase EarP [Burkholderiaceae bacterium]|nr:elongation factor P maturation arginine rhamnosyltransferase EarP [Burkholderiaceae bacterium]
MAQPGPVDAPVSPPAPVGHTPGLRWEIFCRVIDNHGDIGVCWRLCADLAERGHRVRLWVDDPSALAWMAPGALQGLLPGIEVRHWMRPDREKENAPAKPPDVLVEAFGCDIEEERLAQLFPNLPARDGTEYAPPVWINLEYLSAEAWVERCHGLPSPVQRGLAKGQVKTFFFPGFRAQTGGLLRERDLLARQTRFDGLQWLSKLGLCGEQQLRLSLFCYEPVALPAWLNRLHRWPCPVHLLVAAGRPTAAVKALEPIDSKENNTHPAQKGHSPLSISYLPNLTQRDFDHLLWSCHLNFVRGEDSLVRALWAGQPLVWNIYPQDDNAHHAKLEAFLDWLEAPDSLRDFHRIWNGLQPGELPVPEWGAWRACVGRARERLLSQDDLTTQLLRTVAEKR